MVGEIKVETTVNGVIMMAGETWEETKAGGIMVGEIKAVTKVVTMDGGIKAGGTMTAGGIREIMMDGDPNQKSQTIQTMGGVMAGDKGSIMLNKNND